MFQFKCLGFFLLISVCSSCSIYIKGNFKGLYSYYYTTYKQKPDLFYKLSNQDQLCALERGAVNTKIVVIHGKALHQCLRLQQNAIVYLWKPNCKSQMCPDLEVLQRICDAHHIALFVVATYYDAQQMAQVPLLRNPIFGIDPIAYKTNKTKTYVRLFLEELKVSVDSENMYYYFQEGRYVQTIQSIYDIK